jgi:YegS/Rv2252/BmrU family lipid kinase
MSRDTFVFIVNPRSAGGATLRRFERVREAFTRALVDVDVRLTDRPHHATVLARDAVQQGVKAVIAVGGDGTNNEVVNGFFLDDGTPIPTETAFGVVTSGTGGDFRRSFGWTTEPLDDLARLVRFDTRRIDVGCAHTTHDDGKRHTRMFINIGSFGVSGHVSDIVNHSSKALGAKASFMMGSVRGMASYVPKRVRVTTTDEHGHELAREDAITVVAIANGQFFGGGMQIAPNANIADGRFDCVNVAGGGLGFFLRHGLKLYSGKHVTLPECRVDAARHVVAEPVTSSDRVLVELDGEQAGQLPATFEILPGALKLVV